MRRIIMDWIWDGKPRWLTEFIYDNMEFVPKILCFFAGHVAVRDHCMIPEHDYCMWCHKSMPGQATITIP